MHSLPVLVTVLSGACQQKMGTITKFEGKLLELLLSVRLELTAAVSVEDPSRTYYGEICDVAELEKDVYLHRVYLEHSLTGLDQIAHLKDVDSAMLSRAA